MSKTKNILATFRKLGRMLDAMGGWIAVCVDCDYRSFRLHPEGAARFGAICHCKDTGHTVRVLELK